MTAWQIWLVFGVILALLVLLATNRWRYDVIGVAALLVLAGTGIISAEEALAGFSHPAVLTVASVLVISEALQVSRAVDVLGGLLARAGSSLWLRVPALVGSVAAMSGFMNDTGALAALMPAAIGTARQLRLPPSRLLMSIAFASLLGGMITAIGTPANIIIATMRGEVTGRPFALFDFSYVGLPVALIGVLFLGLIGWRLTPQREGSAERPQPFDIRDYLSEVRITADSVLAGQSLAYLGQAVDAEITVVAIARAGKVTRLPTAYEVLQPGDVLVVEADPEGLARLTDNVGVELVPQKHVAGSLTDGSVGIMEAVVRPGSAVLDRTVRDINLRWNYGLNLLAVSRFGGRPATRVAAIRFQIGDVLLLQGSTENLRNAVQQLGLLPLPERPLRLGTTAPAALTLSILGGAIAATVLGVLEFVIAFLTAAFLVVALRVVPPRRAYAAIDWQVIVLLAALLPLGTALDNSGGAAVISGLLTSIAVGRPDWALVAIMFAVTVVLTNLIGAKPATVLAGSVALQTGALLGVSVDPLLMTVAIGASCAFLTPVAHQVNVIVMAPGGYRFTDYLYLGLPLTVLSGAVMLPIILWQWPL